MKKRNYKIIFLLLLFYSSFVSIIFGKLKDTNNKADYLIITPSEFVATIKPFAEWRESKNMEVRIVELDSLYSEFPDTSESNSIRDFVSYSLEYWTDPKPKYLLLVGNGNILPSNIVQSFLSGSGNKREGAILIDELYAVNKYEEDNIADILIGRFPIENNTELENIIEKTILFEDNLTAEDYQNDFLFVTDIDGYPLFHKIVDNFIDKTLPKDFKQEIIYVDNDSTLEKDRKKIFEEISKGTMFLNYCGHGYPYCWSNHQILTLDDCKNLENNNLPFINFSVACSQKYHVPGDSSLVRRLIVEKRKGAVAILASSGLLVSGDGNKYLNGFYSFLFENRGKPIGEAIEYAKSCFGETSQPDAMHKRYTLLGDPALKIPMRKIVYAEENEEIPQDYMLCQNYPNPFNPSTVIQFSLPKTEKVSLKVYDILGREIADLLSDEMPAGTHSVEFSGRDCASGIYIYTLRTGNCVMTKKMTLIK